MWGWIAFGLLAAYLTGFATAIIAGNRYMEQQRNNDAWRKAADIVFPNKEKGNDG